MWKYSGDLKSGIIWNFYFLMVGFQMVQFSNGRALAIAIAIVPTIWKPDLSKSGLFCLDFKWLLTKWWPFVRISNGWASGFQILFEIRTICNPTSFCQFEIQTGPDLKSPLNVCKLQQKIIIFKNSGLTISLEGNVWDLWCPLFEISWRCSKVWWWFDWQFN